LKQALEYRVELVAYARALLGNYTATEDELEQERMMTLRESCLNRRGFLQRSVAGAALAGLTIVPRRVLGGAEHTPPSEKVNIAAIGMGTRGPQVIREMENHNIVALCDVDRQFLARASVRYNKAKTYSDYRRLLDREDKTIDAVVVATPDHHHAIATMAAFQAGKHVYCEKPMAHNVVEIRTMTEAARGTGLATQLGTGAHAGYNYRSVVAMVKAGTIGDVQEVHCWCDQAWAPGDRPKYTPPVPEYLKWDLWLGPAPVRPYHPTYHPHGWRSWWDFGNGRLGDMGCHMIDLPFSALDLKYPLTVEAHSDRPAHKESSPRWLISTWTLPARGNLPPVTLTWYDGDKRPPLQKKHNMPDWPEATLFVGTEGMLVADYGRFKLYPEDKFAGVQRPRLPQGLSHTQEWLAACKTGSSTGCHFDYSGLLSETVLLGMVAHRAGRKLQWDAENLKVTNCPEANQFVRRHYREGWTL